MIKKNVHAAIWEPYEAFMSENEEVRSLMTTLHYPILKNGKFAGLIATDITLDHLQKRVEETRPFDGSYAFLVSNKGLILIIS